MMRIPATSNTRQPSGVAPGGTMGGKPSVSAGRKPGRYQFNLGDVGYLWVLVFIEVGIMGWARKAFRRFHGG